MKNDPWWKERFDKVFEDQEYTSAYEIFMLQVVAEAENRLLRELKMKIVVEIVNKKITQNPYISPIILCDEIIELLNSKLNSPDEGKGMCQK